MNTDLSGALPKPGELHEIVDELITLWKRPPADGQFEPKAGESQGSLAIAYALGAHAYRLAPAAMMIYDAGMRLEALPTIRAAFEHAITAMWVAQYPLAANALVNEGHRQRKNTASTALKGWDVVISLAEEANGWNPLPTDHTSEAQSFQERCRALMPGGDQAYLIYRMFSGLSHPGAHLMEYYLRSSPVGVRRDPKPFGPTNEWPIFMLCCSLVWAARAPDMMCRSPLWRNEHRTAARRLGIPLELRPSNPLNVRRTPRSAGTRTSKRR